MLIHYPRYYSVLIRFVLAFLFVVLWDFLLNTQPAHAGSGPTIIIPPSNIIPVMDGVCSPTEYIDASQVTVTVGTNHTFPVYIKHTTFDAYFCFGDDSGLPLPNGGASQVTVYIDREGDGANYGADFGVWMPYDSEGSPWARYWGDDGSYTGADPGGWEVVKHQILGSSPLWQVEFRISSQTMGGWKHTVGMALFYHWWQWESDDYSWPSNGIWASPQYFGNGYLATDKVDIDLSATVPTVDGQCGSDEYSDASTIPFNTPSGITIAYLEHSLTDVYVCINNLAVPAPAQQIAPNAALYIDRTGTGGDTPSANDISLTITYSGTVQVGTGDGTDFTGPDPGGYDIALTRYSNGWDAEFRISGVTIGNWWSRSIGLSIAEQSVNFPNDDYGWPLGYDYTVPNTWGEANLIGLGSPPVIYLPLIIQGF